MLNDIVKKRPIDTTRVFARCNMVKRKDVALCKMADRKDGKEVIEISLSMGRTVRKLKAMTGASLIPTGKDLEY